VINVSLLVWTSSEGDGAKKEGMMEMQA